MLFGLHLDDHFSLANGEQVSNKVRVEQQSVKQEILR